MFEPLAHIMGDSTVKPATHCYVAKRADEPGAYAACVDMPDLPKETARFVSDIVKKGGIVERVLIKEASSMLGEWIKWRKSKGTNR